ncbi:hypothetical protein HMPREF9120_02729 [Neisseria sp. oral taxon 020 str. F0370]|nr:hypothetical protein HMPREF9120_02729 [Neisseria sp. oral taxon 020 str. F0370]
MHHQVGVAADGGGEVGVVLVGETEMALVFGFVYGLLHGAQEHGLDEFAVGPAADFFGKFGVVFGGGFVAAAETEAEQGELFAQGGEFFGGGAEVVAEEAAVFVFDEEVGGADFGGQHAFFDEFVGVVAHDGDDALDFAVVVEQHFRFDGFKFHRAALRTFFVQDLEEFVEGFDLAFVRVVAARFEMLPDLVVGKAGVRAHDGGVEAVFFDVAGVGDGHVAHHAQALDVGVEGADAVREVFRQHGDNAAGKVDAGGAFVGVAVDGFARADVVADVGDGDDQTVVAALFFGVNGVVEIAGGGTVDGDQRQFAQVFAAFALGGTHFVGDFGGGLGAGGGKFVRQTVFAYGDFDFHAAVGVVAQHFGEAGDGGLVVVRVAFDAGGDDLSLLRLEGGDGIGFEQDGAVETLVFGLHDGDAVVEVEAADDVGLRAFDDVEHFAFAAAAAVGAGGADGDDVAVHQVAHLPFV